jgi:hypothetical protein
MTTKLRAAVLILASIVAGCGGNPLKPEPQGPIVIQNGNPPVKPIAKLEIRDFTVTIAYSNGNYTYVPYLTLAETSGQSDAKIIRTNFELLGIGVNGRVPPVDDRFTVPSGGTVKLAEDDYGGTWLSIDSQFKASGLSVSFTYLDDAFVAGVTSATVQFSE